jgi:hypothetical protein
VRIDAHRVDLSRVAAGGDCKRRARARDRDGDAAAADLDLVLHTM